VGTGKAIAEETASASAPHVITDFQLSLYVQELGDFRVNLEHYNRLVGKDPDSLNTLRQLGDAVPSTQTDLFSLAVLLF
jgi:hypothetical protein